MDVLDYLERLIREDREAFTEQLARGLIPDFAGYKYVAGQVSALDSVLGAIADIRVKQEKEGD